MHLLWRRVCSDFFLAFLNLALSHPLGSKLDTYRGLSLVPTPPLS